MTVRVTTSAPELPKASNLRQFRRDAAGVLGKIDDGLASVNATAAQLTDALSRNVSIAHGDACDISRNLDQAARHLRAARLIAERHVLGLARGSVQ